MKSGGRGKVKKGLTGEFGGRKRGKEQLAFVPKGELLVKPGNILENDVQDIPVADSLPVEWGLELDVL